MQNTRYTQVAYPDSAEFYAIWDHQENDYVRQDGFICGGFTSEEADAFIVGLLAADYAL